MFKLSGVQLVFGAGVVVLLMKGVEGAIEFFGLGGFAWYWYLIGVFVIMLLGFKVGK